MDVTQQAWQLHRRCSQIADAHHENIHKRRRQNLSLIVIGSVTSTASALLVDRPNVARWLAALAGALLASAAMVQGRALAAQRLRRWVVSRAASESLKAGVYQALASGSPATTETTQYLLEKIEKVIAESKDYTVDLQQAKYDGRPLPPVHDASTYLVERAEDQRSWHEAQVSGLSKKANLFRKAELAATVAGVVVSAIVAGGSRTWLAPIVSALMTLAAACAAHLSSTKYERTAIGYALTAERIKRAMDRFNADKSSDPVWFVVTVENVLAEQNANWLALLTAD
jgi:SMODS and SLOG-associating 2TM effector domain 1/Protein of unknown function (DUF4231)